jgi:competence protein ComEA
MFKLKKAIHVLLLSSLPFIAHVAIAGENQTIEFNNNIVTSTDHSSVNLNTATEEELMKLKGIGKKKAQAIIAYRDQHSGFRRIEELDNVKGIGPKLLAANLSRLTLDGNPQFAAFPAKSLPLN